MMASSPDEVLARRRFGDDDQRWFAEASGDDNPLHMDDLVARRSIYGRRVVHGVHALLWALDAFLAARNTSVDQIAVTFRQPIFLEEDVTVVVAGEDESRAEIHVRHEGVVLVAARCELVSGSLRPGDGLVPSSDVEHAQEPLVNIDEQVLARTFGRLRPQHRQHAITGGFAAATEALGEGTVSLLASLSRLVGVECPGLYSLFTGFEVSLFRQDDHSDLLWRVIRYDDRVRAVRMRVDGSGLSGRVDAFVRPEPAAQHPSTDLRELVEPGEFEGMRALVVGGSRGLGEIVAKLVAAGGGSSIVTWHRGAADAAAVVSDIRAAGGLAQAIQFDASDPASAACTLQTFEPPTHLFYFATPRIFVRRVRLFDDALFQNFYSIYVMGFSQLVDVLRVSGVEDLAIFYPSTVAVEERVSELTEYAAAKAAGEIVAHGIAGQVPGLQVLVERLPRLRTDQTASLLAAPAEAPGRLMLKQIRRLAAL